MNTYIGTATSRVDGRAKVTGAAQYAGEFNVPGLAYGSVVTSTIAKGRIARIDASAALARRRRDRRAHPREPAEHGRHRQGLPRRRGAGRLAVPSALRRQDQVQRPADRAGGGRGLGDRALCGHAGARRIRGGRLTSPTCTRGSTRPSCSRSPRSRAATPTKAYAAADVRHEAEYFIPTEHHNPMELFAATVVWNGDGKLTVYDKTQGVQNVQRYVCSVFGLKRGRCARHVAVRRRRVRLGPAPAI